MAQSCYVLVTPARNEEATIEETIRSVLSQTVVPQEWVVVSDGSTDRTDEIVRSYSSKCRFLKLLRLEKRPARNFASVVYATEAGCRELRCSDYEFLGLLDADVRFGPGYFEALISRFSGEPVLGLGGGLVLDVVNGQLVRDRCATMNVAGAVQFFRRECFESIGGLIPIPEGGWDAITCVQARLSGYATRTFEDLVVEHLKPRNSSEGGVVRRKWQMGVRDYALGYHPLFELAKCMSRVFYPPLLIGSLAWLAGYSWCFARRKERLLSPSVVRQVQLEQRRRIRPSLRALGFSRSSWGGLAKNASRKT